VARVGWDNAVLVYVDLVGRDAVRSQDLNR
jgi:hypothetical protein